MTEPIRFENQSINIIAGDKLRPGDVISARVTEILPGNRFRILWKGRPLTAESQLNLIKGQVIKARVEAGPFGTTLKLMAKGSETSGQSSLNPVSSPVTLSPVQQLISAFLKASMPLPSEEQLQRLSRLLSRTKGSMPRLARLQADLISRGADPSADFLEALEELLSASGRRKDSREGGSHQQRNLPDPDKLREMLENQKEDLLLKLINSEGGKPESWKFTRTTLKNDDSINLSWKIRRGHRPAMSLTVHDGSRTFEFLLEGLNPGRMAVFSDNYDEIDSITWKTFRERLSLMNISVDDTLSSMDVSDGFTPGEIG